MSVLEVNNASIRYMTGDFKDIGLKEYVTRRLTHNYSVTEFWADRDVSFCLEKGDMLGIIGSNGAGKSTLLKAVAGIMEPTYGSVRREGSIAALLELGSGFDGDLTVRENTYLRGALLGYTRKFMDDTYDAIIDFAELQDFQDRPFKQLSSGMQSRLAFSIASLVRPDILILDEVLSVGDGAFRKKSEEKMKEIIRGGATTILVSHSLDQVREMCTKVLWLHKGEQIAFGDDVQGICDRYEDFLAGKQEITEHYIKSPTETGPTQRPEAKTGGMNGMNDAEGKNRDITEVKQRHKLRRWFGEAKGEMDRDKLGWLFLAAALAVLTVMTVYNWQHFYRIVNDDLAGEHLYAKKIWDTGNPFFPGFTNNLELFISRPWPLFLAVYAFVRDLAQAAQLEAIICIWLLTFSAVYFFRKLRWSWPAVLLATAAFWGLMSQMVKDFLVPSDSFINFYMGVFLAFGLFIDIAENRDKKGRTFKSILLYGLAFYFGLCGVRMMIYLYIPLEAVMMLKWITENLNGRKLSPVQRNKLLHSSMQLVVYVVALAINVFVIIPYMHGLKFSSTLVSYGTIWEKARGAFMYMLEALDIEFSGDPAMSPRSILTLYKIALAGILVWSGLFLWKKDTYKECEKEALMLFLITVAELVFIFTFTTDNGFAGRFFAAPMVVAFMVGMSFNYLRSSTNMRLLCGGFCLFILAGMCLTLKLSYPEGLSSVEEPSALLQLTQYLEDTGRDRIAGHYWNVTTPIFFSNCKITGMTLHDNESLQPYDHITDRTYYANDDEPVTLILTGEQKNSWEKSEKRAYLLSIADGTDEVAGYYLYDYDENPFAFDLYNSFDYGNSVDYGLDIRYNFLQLAYTEGAALDDGNIVLHPGDTQYGPYKTMKAGTYDVTVRGEGLENGTVDVISAGTVFALENMEVLPNQVTYTVRLDNDMPNMEFRCINDSAETVKIKDITITPWNMKAVWM